MNERVVRDAFGEAVVRYCNRVNAAGVRAGGTLEVTVTTAVPLSTGTQEWIYHLTRAHARQMLRVPRDPVLSFPQVGGLPAPGYEFRFGQPAEPVPRREPGPVALLTLRYDPDFVWPCRIGAATDWLALGRWSDRDAAQASAMQLPTYATWLPRGPLLLVHNQHGRFTFGRSEDRPQYEIRIDGVALRPGGSAPAHPGGSIEYALDRSSTRLTYSVGWENCHVR